MLPSSQYSFLPFAGGGVERVRHRDLGDRLEERRDSFGRRGGCRLALGAAGRRRRPSLSVVGDSLPAVLAAGASVAAEPLGPGAVAACRCRRRHRRRRGRRRATPTATMDRDAALHGFPLLSRSMIGVVFEWFTGRSARARRPRRPVAPVVGRSTTLGRSLGIALRLARATATSRARPLNSGVIQYTPPLKRQLQALDAERQRVDGGDGAPDVGPVLELGGAEEHGGEGGEQQRRPERVRERADLGAVDDPGQRRPRRPTRRASPTPSGRCARRRGGPPSGWRRWPAGAARAACTRSRTR